MKLSVRQCDSTKSEDGGSCGPQVPCDGTFWSDGSYTGGCGEPCSFIMDSGLTAEQCLALAWTYCAPKRLPSAFPRGFWPDVARVAMAMFEQQTATPTLDFRPCRCTFGDAPEPRTKSKSGIDLSKLEITL